MYQSESFKSHLLTWFDENKRAMPWRETKNPYYIWLSEVMLQQTQVDTVRSYYQRFIERFPTVEDLSEADEDIVLKHWEGLGYYSRARNFHTAIKEVVAEYNGEVPNDPEKFKKLKGVGPYTQAAVMSIAFQHPLPTVDGNVFRVWSRLNNDTRDIAKATTRKAYEAELTPYVQERAGDFNESMMELGAVVCTPKNPLCLFCPVQSHCEAFDKGTVETLPVKTKKMKKKTVKQRVYLIENEAHELLIEQRQQKLLNGMWQFPMYERDAVPTVLENWSENDVEISDVFYTLKHQFTHMTWDIEVVKLNTKVDREQLPEGYHWMPIHDKEDYNFPVSMSKIYRAYIADDKV